MNMHENIKIIRHHKEQMIGSYKQPITIVVITRVCFVKFDSKKINLSYIYWPHRVFLKIIALEHWHFKYVDNDLRLKH